MSFNNPTTRPSYQTAGVIPGTTSTFTPAGQAVQGYNSNIPMSTYSSDPIYSQGLNQTQIPASVTSLPYTSQPLAGQQQFSGLQGQQFVGQPLAGQQQFVGQPLTGQQQFVGQPLVGQQLSGLPGQQGTLPNGQPLPTLPNSEVELKKRMLDKHRDLKMKEAEMETNKEKKLEEKADKQREKAVKWTARGVMPGMAHRHETKADKLESQAHEHHMKAESYKLEAKVLEGERKSYDPPKEDKKTPSKPGMAGSKQAASKTTEVKKDEAKKDAPTAEIKKTETTTTQAAPKTEQSVVLEKKAEHTTDHPIGTSTA